MLFDTRKTPAPLSHQSAETHSDTREREREKHNKSYLSGADKDKLQKQSQKRPSNTEGPSHDLAVGRKAKCCSPFSGICWAEGAPRQNKPTESAGAI